MTLAEVREQFHKLCIELQVTPAQIIKRRGTAKVQEARKIIIKTLYASGAKTWQIKEVLPRDSTTLTKYR